MKKRLICIVLCLCLVFLASCNGTSSTGGGNDGSGNQSGSGEQNGGSQDSGTQGGGTQDSGTQGGGTQGGGTQGDGTQGSGTQGGGTQGGGSQSTGSEKEKIKGYLSTLLSGFRVDPYSYLPESMIPGANAVSAASLTKDYTSGVQVSAIPTGGFGEQWNMIIENMVESQRFFTVLSVVDGLTTTSVSVFNNYLDENPADTASHTFKEGIYTVSIVYEDGVLEYVIDYENGAFAPQIALSLDVASGEKTVRVQLSDANALRYIVTEDSYEFAVRYAGVRRAYFSLSRTEDGAEGHIYEYLTVASVEHCSAADFYITEDYVTAVGNKASGIPGFTGYICELYDVESGKMLGYEVKETLSLITFDTLWFDLASFDGLTSLRYRPESGTGNNKTEAAFFVNGKSAAWVAKKTLGSRRYDIEFRDRFFYVYNEGEESYEKVTVSVPMLFVQEKYYSSLASDVASENSGVNLTSRVNSDDLTMLEGQYDEKVNVFVENKENISVEQILTFIGSKKTFE
ncbi:MAG: hypothetical protein E7657_03990 [Ruminococcaceae bacterium]|nr:hypothetical protein [Oscillospiraceae bacterium]